MVELTTNVEVGSRVRLSGSNLRGRIIEFLTKDKHLVKHMMWKVRWDDGMIGCVNIDEVEPLND